MATKNADTPGIKAAKTKGPIERHRAAKAAAWTKKHEKDAVKNPYSRPNYYGRQDGSR